MEKSIRYYYVYFALFITLLLLNINYISVLCCVFFLCVPLRVRIAFHNFYLNLLPRLMIILTSISNDWLWLYVNARRPQPSQMEERQR